MLFSLNTLNANDILIALESQSCLLAILSNPFSASLCPFILTVKSLIHGLHFNNKLVQFLWVHSHVGIASNEMVDHQTCLVTKLRSFLIPYSDFLIWNIWQHKWSSLLLSYASWHRRISALISSHQWFWGLKFSDLK